MTDDDKIRNLLVESVDAELGERRTVPPFDARALAARSGRRPHRAVWVLPLAAAAAVAAIVTGTVAVVDSASSGPVRPATSNSSDVPTPSSTATTPDPRSSASSANAAASSAAVRAAASRAAAARARAASASASASASRASAAASSRAAASAAAASASASAAAVQAGLLARFRGPWLGHDRTLTVDARGIATEMLTSGCCSPQLHVTFALTDVRGSPSRPVATATVTSVRLDPGFTYDPGEARPHVGETATVTIVGGVLAEPFTGTQYCASGVNRCGA